MDGRISNFMQAASIRRCEMTEGKERGLKVLDCDNGKLRFLLNESKALDVMQLYCEGKNVSFISKNGFTARELPFAERFEGGMLYTCGLDSVGGREGYDLHGTHHNYPAKVMRAECSEEGIVVEAETEESALFGRDLLFRRCVKSPVGGNVIEICDTIVNKGFRDEPYCLLYHVNVGYPFLEEGARVEGDVAEAVPRTPWAAEHLAEREKITAPVAGQEEMCYFLRMNSPCISLVNEKLGKAFTLRWSGDTLPHFVQWKSMASGDYALGLEPATCGLDGGFAYNVLPAGKSVRFRLVFEVRSL